MYNVRLAWLRFVASVLFPHLEDVDARVKKAVKARELFVLLWENHRVSVMSTSTRRSL